MLNEISVYLDLILKFISIFWCERYVFLEKGLEEKKQREYYIISIIVIYLANRMFNEHVASFFLMLAGGLNISLVRKEHRFRGFLLMIPIAGIINGLVVPVLTLPAGLFSFSRTGAKIYKLIVYSLAAFGMISFCTKGRCWRKKFLEEMSDRHLQKWESFLLCLVGVLMMIYSQILSGDILVMNNPEIYDYIIRGRFSVNMCLMGSVAFILTVTIIMLIMQGSKQSYYYERSINMQKVEMEKKKAEAANEAKSAFLSNMSHEIRTPMNAIVGITDILLREEHSKETREYLNHIKSSGVALLNIINDILDFSKIESGKLDIVEDEYEPMSMFHDLSMIFMNRIGDKPVELLYDIDIHMPTKLRGDAQRLRQIMINIMNNAIKFTEQGYVRLSVQIDSVREDEMQLTFLIEDTGQGIKEEDIGKLFDSFSQVDTKKNHDKEGTGLGLAISKQLVELMHGSIGVKSTYGEGSTFYFTVPQKIVDARYAAKIKTREGQAGIVGFKLANPYIKQQLEQLADAYQVECADMDQVSAETVDFFITDNRKSLSPNERMRLETQNTVLCVLQNPMERHLSNEAFTILNKPVYSLNFCQLLNREELVFQSSAEEELHFTAPKARILVVDDNETNLKVAEGLLEPFHMQMDVARNGKEALMRVQEKEYHMVFLDHMMPVMDGIEAVRAIRKLEGERYRTLPIIALSANATAEAREMFLSEGMDDFVAKPIKLKEIGKCILKWLPKELITMGTVEEVVKNVTKSEEVLPVIEGLDVLEGIQNCGSQKLFIELLGDFYKLIDVKCTKIEKCLADGMIRDYTIEVHALKNTARMIGAMKLSDLFAQMEKLGIAGEEEEIKARTPEVLELYRSYKPILEVYGKVQLENRVHVSTEEMCQALMRLHDAMDNFDVDTADATMKELETWVFPENMQSMVDKLGAFVADVAMEDVMHMTEVMCAKLREKETKESEKKALIMLVDDDAINCKAVTKMLEDEFCVMTAESGRKAFELLEKYKPDIILLDIYMPEMDGHAVIRALKENPEYAEIPVIFLTSDEDENTEVQGFDEGATDFIRKPFRKGVAVQRIRRILELSYLQNNLKQEVEKQTEVAECRRKRVERVSLQMVHALANTIDAKDSYTNGHSTRVAKYSVMIAERMGYSGDKLERLQYAALLHDIGKIGVPREIINKPSKLTDEEYAIIKTHPVIGGTILDEISEIPDIAIGARWHHERYDGKGYPDHLKEVEIPELARIIGVADAYDAMTSKRSYRDVLSQETVYNEIEKGKASQFDPEIADIMLHLMKEDSTYQMHE